MANLDRPRKCWKRDYWSAISVELTLDEYAPLKRSTSLHDTFYKHTEKENTEKYTIT